MHMPFVTSNLCHDVTHVISICTVHATVIYLPFSLNDSNITLYRFTYFCRFEVVVCLSLKSSSLAPPYTQVNNLYVFKGPLITHNMCNIAPVWIFLGFQTTYHHTLVPLYNLTLIYCHTLSKVKDFLSSFVESVFNYTKLGLICCC